ncbi:helix-turn-helix domain-containing protein [Luteolibacter algae]|uniref:Helix-turn-helix domain-containing protein n=1 Tax=Luteolibacter algae TaxID=454151 RepID=A0ABW5DEN2_9BACT
MTDQEDAEWIKKQEQFREALHGAQLQQLFNYLPGVYFVAKCKDGQVMMANQLAAQLCGQESEKDMIGKSDYDLFPSEQAEGYTRDDRQVYETGVPIIDRVELAPDPKNAINWFITTKLPLYGQNKKIIGLACIARNMEDDSEKVRPYAEMNDVLEYIRINYAAQIRVEDLAALAHLSVGQFERNFKKIFGISPKQHLMNVRIQAASHLLRSTHHTITSIAHETGFYDHSHFSRSFKKELGVSPGEYRKPKG